MIIRRDSPFGLYLICDLSDKVVPQELLEGRAWTGAEFRVLAITSWVVGSGHRGVALQHRPWNNYSPPLIT